MTKIIGKRIKIVDCKECNSIIQFDKDDVLDESQYGLIVKFIKCPCCGYHVQIVGGETKYYHYIDYLN